MSEVAFAEFGRATRRHLASFLGPWAIAGHHLDPLVARWNASDQRRHIAAAELAIEPATLAYFVSTGGAAVLRVDGMLTKYGNSFDGGGSLVALRKQVLDADRDPTVKSLLLVVESPGGTVAGTSELASAIHNFSKPTFAFLEDLAASGAYWIASQAQQVFANEAASVGSIGVFSVVRDSSGQAEQSGIKVHVVSSGAHKGAATPGTVITPEQIAVIQETVNSYAELFCAAVRRGRGLSAEELSQVTDGRVFDAKTAVTKKLIQGVSTFEEVLVMAESVSSASSSVVAAPPTTPAPQRIAASLAELRAWPAPQRIAASLAELRACCPGATSEFLLAQIEQGATASDAMQAWCRHLAARVELSEASGSSQPAAGTPATNPTIRGHQPLSMDAGETDTEGAAATYRQRLQGLMDRGLNRLQAVKQLNRESPELRRALVNTANAAAGREFRV